MPQENTFASKTEYFNKALSFQQQKNWDEALTAYRELLDQSQNDLSPNQAAAVYHNMSIVASQKGDLIRAHVWSRKAHELDLGNTAARLQLEQTSKSFSSPSIPHQISNYEQVQRILEKVPPDLVFFSTLVLVLATLMLALRVRILNRRSIIIGDHRNSKKWPVWVIGFISSCFLLFSLIRFDATQKVKALVIQDQAQIQTVPGENKSVIFQAPAGLELEVIGLQDNYYQVRHPGAFSGWIEKSKIELLSLSFRH
jgi:tetratricopeptide (TPR) repeat protein